MACRGNQRHWFGVQGMVGVKTPVCTRCGARNPRKLTDEEFEEIRAMRRAGEPVGRHVKEFFEKRYGDDEDGDE